MHGHNWKVEVEVSGNKLDNIGMVMDFKEIKKSTNEIVNELDHQFLNDLKPFENMNPTAENIAQYIYHELAKILSKDDVQVKSIKLWENDRSAVTYSE
jgi:6-pyruvoyltetrahydropterin/6-carboxytetrahydropterin synthase|tara:strand:+ start:2165 stop:2458 length:294 start_codon:yes stop_codon:yes gene_type:complete